MADVNPHKIGTKQKRRAKTIWNRLEDQGVGRDHAEKVASREAAEDPSAGGFHSAGDQPKHAHRENDHRTGSEKKYRHR